MLLAQKTEKQKEREAKLTKLKERKKRYLEKKEVEKFIKDSEEKTRSRRRVHLMFNQNDEMVERESSESDQETPQDNN